MIQVIERVFRILEELSVNGELSLNTLSQITALNKGTLCNILATLVHLGYVRKSRGGHYLLSERLADLRYENSFSPSQLLVFRETVTSLAEVTEESGVLTELRGGKVSILFQAQHQQPLMINPAAVYASLSLYHSVSGRILFAMQSPERAGEILAVYGFPREQWDGIDTPEALEKACREIRRAKISVMENRENGIISFAVPVEAPAEKVLALGLTMPLSRCDARTRKTVLGALKEHAAKIAAALSPRGE